MKFKILLLPVAAVSLGVALPALAQSNTATADPTLTTTPMVDDDRDDDDRDFPWGLLGLLGLAGLLGRKRDRDDVQVRTDNNNRR